MANTPIQSEQYLAAANYSLAQFFTTFVSQQETLLRLQTELEEIESARVIRTEIFLDRDQWSVNANYLYGQFLDRLQRLDIMANAIGTTEQQQLSSALATMGATEESMSVIAGAILQVGKQVLSYRHGAKGNLPTSRMVGTQHLTEVVWEGRNHAMHWEEHSPRPPVTAMLNALATDLQVQIVPNSNNSWAILAAIGWTNENEMVAELKQLIQ